MTRYAHAISVCAALTLTTISHAEEPASIASVNKFIAAAETGDKESLLTHLKEGVDVNAKSPMGLTAWTVAKRAGFVEIADLLESKGARTDIPVPSVGKLVDRGIGKAFSGDSPGCAILVSQNGEVLFEKVYGYANIEKKTPVTRDTKFRIGSVSKQFTAAAILKLQEECKLSVSDKLSKFIADFPRGDDVTIYHLLTHTSGIKSFTSKPSFMETVTQPTTESDLINSFKNDPYDFDPGERYSYNNSGYFLLGHIVGKVSDSSYAEYLDSTFFQPLGMKDSGIHAPDLDLANEAVGYSKSKDKINLSVNWHMSRAGGAGAIYSTLHDLYKWNEALFGGKVLSEESLATAFAPTRLNDGNTTDYGFGWAIGNHRGLPVINHSGGLHGFQSYLVRYPQQNTTIVVFTNVRPSGGHPTPPAIAMKIAEYVLWEQMDSREIRVVDASVGSETLKNYVGIYDYGAPMLMEVTLEDGQLYAQLTGQPKFPIFASTETKFFWKVVDAEVEFVRDEAGTVVAAIHNQNGSSARHKRLPAKAKLTLTNEQLDAFVGEYDYKTATMRVTRQGNQLFAQLTGQPKLKIYPQSETKFAWAVVEAEVEFVKDGDGSVIKGIHTQGGRIFDVPRMKETVAIELSEEKLDEYVGRYNYGLLAGKMVVTRDGKKLMAKLRGQPALEIVPVAEDEFRWRDVNATIKFERDDAGNITRGLHTQGGRTIKVPRVK